MNTIMNLTRHLKSHSLGLVGVEFVTVADGQDLETPVKIVDIFLINTYNYGTCNNDNSNGRSNGYSPSVSRYQRALKKSLFLKKHVLYNYL